MNVSCNIEIQDKSQEQIDWIKNNYQLENTPIKKVKGRCIMRVLCGLERRYMSLRIAIVGFNYKNSQKALKEIIEADCSKIKRRREDVVEMEDGTMYYIFHSYNNVRGHCIDQLIVVDDFRWEVYRQQYDLIDWIKYRIDCTSYIPEEFQIQEYEYPVTSEKDRQQYYERQAYNNKIIAQQEYKFKAFKSF